MHGDLYISLPGRTLRNNFLHLPLSLHPSKPAAIFLRPSQTPGQIATMAECTKNQKFACCHFLLGLVALSAACWAVSLAGIASLQAPQCPQVRLSGWQTA